MDAIVAMLSRNFPNPVTDMAREEGRRHVRAFQKHHPDLVGLLHFSDEPAEYQGQAGQFVYIPADSRLVRVMEAFAARVGLALYREHYGHPAPSVSRVHASWHPNVMLDADEDINALLRAMGHGRTLAQGSWRVAEQFRYWVGAPEDQLELFCAFAAFRHSFGVLAIVDPTGRAWPENTAAFRPGFLNGFKV